MMKGTPIRFPQQVPKKGPALESRRRKTIMRRLAGGPTTVQELAVLLRISEPTVLFHLRRLMWHGFIRRYQAPRQHTPEGKRPYLYVLEAKGKEWLDPFS